MNKKELLHSICPKRREVDYLQERVVRLKSAMMSQGSMSFYGRGSRYEMDKIGANLGRLEELEQKLKEKELSLQETLIIFETMLENMSEKQRVIMRLRYEQGLSWREVGKQMNYSKRQCYRLIEKYLR